MVFDGHSDIFSDVRYKREAGETQGLKNRHLERLQKGGIGGGCFVIWVDTFNGEDPKKELDAIIKNMKDEMAETKEFVLVHNTAEIEAARKAGAIVMADEVQTGIGRTGEWFGCNHDGVTPDLMACAKALGGGVMPIGAIIGSPKAWQGLIEAPFLHTSTFGGNQLACAAGVAAIKYIKEENVLARGKAAGEHLIEGLKKIAAEFPTVIKEVRGKGMMVGIELTKEGAGGMLMALMIDKNVIVAYTLNNPKVIRMEPPLIVPKEVVDEVLAKFHEAVKMTAEVIEDLD